MELHTLGDAVAPFRLTIPRSDGTSQDITVGVGETVFVFGANGTGKSSLMHRFYSAHSKNSRRISAHRQTWFASSANVLSAGGKQSSEADIQSRDVDTSARWKDEVAGVRPSISIYDLINAENVRARSIAAAVDGADGDRAKTLSKKQGPIKLLNELLRLSGMPIEIQVNEDDKVQARKSGGVWYSAAELSDGERNALLIAADVLTASEGNLFLIDEPERHLHRSIISPLLTSLFAKRPDCAFVISTHDVMLPLDNPSARTLLVRGCTYTGSSATAWEADLVPSEAEIDDDLKKDILGARKKVLFIEGTERSLDKALYSLVFPAVTVIAKSSCRDVEHAVFGIREADNLHWLHAFGIVDNDRRAPTDIDQLKKRGVYALSVFSVESAYYHPEIQRRVAERHSGVVGGDAERLLAEAKAAAIEAVRPHIQRLSAHAAEKAVREEIFRHLPRRDEVFAEQPIRINIDVAAMVASERRQLENALNAGNLLSIIGRYSIRETPALDAIVNRLGLQSRAQYERAVRKLLIDDDGALTFVKTLFGNLVADIDAA